MKMTALVKRYNYHCAFSLIQNVKTKIDESGLVADLIRIKLS